MKKIPLRRCLACNEQVPKNELLRIVKSKDGIIEIDLTGKKDGRGAYICKKEQCLDRLIKSKRLEKIFQEKIALEFYESIRGVVIE